VTLYNLVKVYTVTTGQDDLILGAAVPGFLTFAQASVPNGGTVSYGIKDGNYSEVGRGVYNNGTLTRSVLASNDGGAKLFLSGLAEVFITILAEDVTAPAGDVVGDDTSTTAQNIVAYTGTGGKNITELTGTQGDILFHNGTNWAKLAAGTLGQYLETNGAGANPSWQFGAIIHYSKSAGATTTGANQTPVSVTDAVFSYVENAVYRIWVMGRLNSTAATTGAGIQFDLSSEVTAINVQFFHQLASAGTLTGGHSIADDTSVGVSSGVPAGPLDVPITAFGLLVTGANVGTAQLRLRAEVNAVTELLAGVVMVVERLG